MTSANTLLFQNISEEETAMVTGGRSVISNATAGAYLVNDVGGITSTSTYTTAIDQGTHIGVSQSSSLAVAYNDTDNNTITGIPSLDQSIFNAIGLGGGNG